ncbi:Uma2 family endonuclease [Streptomyces sp. JJ36]|uniref:Uma2 family endonuclease n=1 Tax=Streptomyces sp. JJ36 TaxID=2736645 RepID=UPI001F1D8568|nr:Uma2 family endonuclease [Streptomyces sp. JJ36]MCF6525068.1 Uma2 family endonuclease [Streptomyces sp. JJ36]
MRAQDVPLRALADKAARRTGLRAEVVGGAVVLSPPPCGKHFGAAARVRRQLEKHVLDTFTVAEVSSVRALDGSDDYATPDLMVLPMAWEESDEWLADPDTVELVVEVVSQSNHSKDTTQMPAWYAAARIPLFLLVDPRDGTWVLRARPDGAGREAAYSEVVRGRFGEVVPLPEPLGFELATELPVYGEVSGTASRRGPCPGRPGAACPWLGSLLRGLRGEGWWVAGSFWLLVAGGVVDWGSPACDGARAHVRSVAGDGVAVAGCCRVVAWVRLLALLVSRRWHCGGSSAGRS